MRGSSKIWPHGSSNFLIFQLFSFNWNYEWRSVYFLCVTSFRPSCLNSHPLPPKKNLYHCSFSSFSFTISDHILRYNWKCHVAGVYIHPNCTDNPFFANCRLIVAGQYCTHKYYARFCCKSCTQAGQLPSYGPHLEKSGTSMNSSRRKWHSQLVTPTLWVAQYLL